MSVLSNFTSEEEIVFTWCLIVLLVDFINNITSPCKPVSFCHSVALGTFEMFSVTVWWCLWIVGQRRHLEQDICTEAAPQGENQRAFICPAYRTGGENTSRCCWWPRGCCDHCSNLLSNLTSFRFALFSTWVSLTYFWACAGLPERCFIAHQPPSTISSATTCRQWDK